MLLALLRLSDVQALIESTQIKSKQDDNDLLYGLDNLIKRAREMYIVAFDMSSELLPLSKIIKTTDIIIKGMYNASLLLLLNGATIFTRYDIGICTLTYPSTRLIL